MTEDGLFGQERSVGPAAMEDLDRQDALLRTWAAEQFGPYRVHASEKDTSPGSVSVSERMARVYARARVLAVSVMLADLIVKLLAAEHGLEGRWAPARSYPSQDPDVDPLVQGVRVAGLLAPILPGASRLDIYRDQADSLPLLPGRPVFGISMPVPVHRWVSARTFADTLADAVEFAVKHHGHAG